jgi:hypothetical protein
MPIARSRRSRAERHGFARSPGPEQAVTDDERHDDPRRVPLDALAASA